MNLNELEVTTTTKGRWMRFEAVVFVKDDAGVAGSPSQMDRWFAKLATAMDRLGFVGFKSVTFDWCTCPKQIRPCPIPDHPALQHP